MHLLLTEQLLRLRPTVLTDCFSKCSKIYLLAWIVLKFAMPHECPGQDQCLKFEKEVHSNTSANLLQLIMPPFNTTTPNTLNTAGVHTDKSCNSNLQCNTNSSIFFQSFFMSAYCGTIFIDSFQVAVSFRGWSCFLQQIFVFVNPLSFAWTINHLVEGCGLRRSSC